MGGTVFLSRAMVETSLAAGHRVTTFSRGLTGSPVPGAEALTGDRTSPADLAQLAGRHFDQVFDTGYFPEPVRMSAELLEPTVGHYTFVSTINVWPGWPTAPDYHDGGIHDGDPDTVGDWFPPELAESGPYGWRKVAAERAVLRDYGEGRTSILRAGLIIGPHDGIGRLPWWLDRIARGGPTLAPGTPDDEMRLIDARDIAAFALRRVPGTFEVTGPAGQLTRGALFDAIRSLTGSDAEFRWASDEFLKAAGVEEWTELPLWLYSPDAPSAWLNDTAAAEAAGLACRPVAETLADTWAWMRTIEGGWQPAERTPGLSPSREADLLSRL